MMEIYAPSEGSVNEKHPKDHMWWEEEQEDDNAYLGSYIV